MPSNEQLELARWACEQAVQAGASQARVRVVRSRRTSLQYRDRQVDTLQESTRKGMTLTLYQDGKYSTNDTNDLRRTTLLPFIAESLAMTRHLATDAHRRLPDPELYAGRAEIDLELVDAGHAGVSPTDRHAIARAIEEAALEFGGDRLISVDASYTDIRYEAAMVTSNGFEGFTDETWFSYVASATARDEDDKRPQEWWSENAHHRDELSDPVTIGRRAVERALARVGAAKIPTETLPLIIENRATRRPLGFLRAALSGRNLQQRQSFLEGKRGEQIAAETLTLIDDPLVVRGRGSRLHDDEGLVARRMPVIDRGVLTNYYIDTYYGRKLDMPPTTGGPSNLTLTAEAKKTRSPAAWMAELGRGILVTSFLGGNSNSSTGDFSTGLSGFLFENGAITRPISGLNIAGNHLEFWHHLIGLGDDPYPFSSYMSPSLVFDGVLVAGS